MVLVPARRRVLTRRLVTGSVVGAPCLPVTALPASTAVRDKSAEPAWVARDSVAPPREAAEDAKTSGRATRVGVAAGCEAAKEMAHRTGFEPVASAFIIEKPAKELVLCEPLSPAGARSTQCELRSLYPFVSVKRHPETNQGLSRSSPRKARVL